MISSIDDNIKSFFRFKVNALGIDNRNVVAINQFNSFNISKEQVSEALEGKGYNKYIYYHQFGDEYISGAYEPFLKYIRELVRELDINIEQMYRECEVINMQKELYDSILASGIAKRIEFVIRNEANYERACFENSLKLIIKYLAKRRPTMFVFNRLHFAGGTTIDLINDLIVDSVPEIGMFVSYDNTYKIPSYMKDIWNELVNTFIEYEVIIEWSSDHNENDVHTRTLSINKLEEYYIGINNLRLLYAYDQAYDSISTLDKFINRYKDKIDINMRYSFYGMFATISVFKGKTANAILYCNEIKSLKNDPNCSEEMADKVEFYYNFLLGYAQMYNEQEKDARISALKAIEAAEKTGSEERIFSAELIEHMSRFSGWKDNVWLGDVDEERDYLLLKKAEKFGFVNHLAHIYVYAFDNDIELYRNVDGLENRISHWKKGIDLAKELNNDKFALEACRKAIMLASVSGFYKVSDYIYKSYSMPIVVETNNRFEEANVYNGLGFNQCMEGSYVKANYYFNKALSLFVELNNYDFVCETLYNMAINCISAKDFENGDIYVSASIRILRYLKTDMLRVAHKSKINGMKALCTLMNGNMYTAEEYIRKAGLYLWSIIDMPADDPYMKYWRDDVFLYNYVKMCIEYENKNYGKMECYMERLKELFIEGGTFEALLYGATDVKTFGERYEQEKLHCKSNKDKLVLENYSIKYILAKCKNATSTMECEMMKNDIDFLATWKQLIRKFNTNKFLLAENACISIENNYNLDNCMVIEYTHGEPAVLFNSGEYISMESMKKIRNYFDSNPEEFFTSKYDRSFEMYKEIVTLFDIKSIENFCCFPHFSDKELDKVVVAFTRIRNTWNKQDKKINFEEDNAQLLNILFSELMDAIDTVNAKIALGSTALLEADNEKLKRIANYDRLTGLYNRNGFYEAIEEYNDKNIKSLCLAFIDLDNFKYYNDHFGHDIGDMILTEVAIQLKAVCAENDIAVRYGGDEFLIIINTDSCKEAYERVNAIYKEFEKHNYFIDVIRDKLSKKINIPDEYKISCSIGIAKIEGDDINKGISEAITKADGALYYIKRTTKKQSVIWDDIKDKIN